MSRSLRERRRDQSPLSACLRGSGFPVPVEGSPRCISLSWRQRTRCKPESRWRRSSYCSQVSPSNTIERIQLLRGGPIPLSLPMSLQRPLDLLHERFVLEDVQRLLLPLPILGADDHEVLPTPTFDAQRNVILNHLFDCLPQVATEFMSRHLSHDAIVPESGTTGRAGPSAISWAALSSARPGSPPHESW